MQCHAMLCYAIRCKRRYDATRFQLSQRLNPVFLCRCNISRILSRTPVRGDLSISAGLRPWLAPTPFFPSILLLADPLEDRLVAENVLSQALHHANSLSAEVFNCLLNQIHLAVEDPVRAMWLMRFLAFPHVVAIVGILHLHRGNTA